MNHAPRALRYHAVSFLDVDKPSLGLLSAVLTELIAASIPQLNELRGQLPARLTLPVDAA